MIRFKKGDKAWAARLNHGRFHIGEVLIVSCGKEKATLARDVPATGYRRQVYVIELFATEAEAREWVGSQASQRVDSLLAEADVYRKIAAEMRTPAPSSSSE